MNEPLLLRITANPEIFGGKPIVRGMRISVELILSLLAQGTPNDEILDDYPELEPEDIRACLEYARAVTGPESGLKASLGTRLAQRFASIGLDEGVPELRGQPARPAAFEP